jgi:fluoride exporter
MNKFVLIAIGGACGSMSRFWISTFLSKLSILNISLSTLVVNILGCFMIGLFQGYFQKYHIIPNWSYLCITGFCGGFTTFSAFTLEHFILMQQGHYFESFIQIMLHITLCLIAVFIGFYFSKI